jgi:hypothetical protein
LGDRNPSQTCTIPNDRSEVAELSSSNAKSADVSIFYGTGDESFFDIRNRISECSGEEVPGSNIHIIAELGLSSSDNCNFTRRLFPSA